MPTTVTAAPYGAAAYDALRDAVRAAKNGDPLSLVRVVVPSERVGVVARRALARGDAHTGPGIAAVTIVTLRRLAEQSAAYGLLAQDRRPLSQPALADAVRRVLAADPGPFAPVADHRGTVRALAEAHRELRPHRPETLDALNEDVAAATVALHRALDADLRRTTYDETDLLRAARPAADATVVFLPQDLDPPEIDLLAGLDATVIFGLTGDRHVDLAAQRLALALGHEIELEDADVPTAARVLHASDPDDEVRAVVRRVAADLRVHPGHRIAVLHPSSDPYARLLHEHLRRAEITFFGRGVRPALETPFGRTVLRLLALPELDFGRADVLAVVADGPVLHVGRRAPSSAWERVSRAAGVTRGDGWSRLDTFSADQRRQASDERDREDTRDWLVARLERDATTADQLAAFVADLRSGLHDLDHATTWADAVTAVEHLLANHLADPSDSTSRAVASTLEAARHGTSKPGRRALAELLELDLDIVLDRVGTIGVGVHVGPVSEGIGDDVEAVYVLGAAEGLLPPRAADDPLLPDRLRAGTTLPTTRDRTARQHRHLLAALAAAPRAGRTVSFPRGDLRRGGERVPSRWLLPTMRAIGRDRDLQATGWQTSQSSFEASTSYVGALLHDEPATAQEWRQQAATHGVTDHTTDRARELRSARLSSAFTEFDGNLAGERIPELDHLSPTALESWVICPQAYFQRRLLGVGPVEEPEEVVRISALEKGVVLHRVWDRLVNAALGEGWAPGPGEPWPRDATERLEVLAEDEFARAEGRGVTGARLLWQQDRRVMRRDLDRWLAEDDVRRARRDQAFPVGAEHEFGNATTPAVEIALDGGTALRLRGQIDRVDRTRDGGLVVTDYKTGKADDYKSLTRDDPTDHGQRLQLPVYALAARAAYGDVPVRSEYWFTSARGNFTLIGYDVTDAVLTELRRVLTTIVDSIRDGVFLARPPAKQDVPWVQCAWCDPDALGHQHVTDAWARKTAGAAALRLMLEGS